MEEPTCPLADSSGPTARSRGGADLLQRGPRGEPPCRLFSDPERFPNGSQEVRKTGLTLLSPLRMQSTSLGRMALLKSSRLTGFKAWGFSGHPELRYEDWIQLSGPDAIGFNIASAWKSKVGNRGEGRREHLQPAWRQVHARRKYTSQLLEPPGVSLEKAKEWAEETLEEAEEEEESEEAAMFSWCNQCTQRLSGLRMPGRQRE